MKKFNTINYLYTQLEALYIKKMQTLQKINKMKHSNRHPEYAELLGEPPSLKKLSEEYNSRKASLNKFFNTLADINHGKITKESLYNNIENLALKSEAFVNARIELNHNIGIYRYYKKQLTIINNDIRIIKDQIQREITLQHDMANRAIEITSDSTGCQLQSGVNAYEPRVYAHDKNHE